jgi:lysophospholipase L1-like esterase
VSPGGVLAVGASVMLAAEPQLVRRLGARVDAAVGRQPSTIVNRLATYRAARALPPVVVVQIGDNGPVWSADIARLRQVLSGVRHVVLVNIREATSWEGEVNDELAQAIRDWPQATIADWQDASANPSLLYDGAHPNPAGAAVYAAVIAHALAG